MLIRFWLSVGIIVALCVGTHAQCADPSPSGDCDQDGIVNGLDSDADNDGILDLFECQDLVDATFESSNGISTSFMFPGATTGIFIDLYALDNSFKINVNGTDLVDDELQFQTGPSTPADSDLIYASDGTRYGRNGNPQIWNIDGGPGDPIVRLKISVDGQVLILGKRFTNSPLERLIVQPGDPQFNSLNWNLNSPNTITISQEVVGPTYINGQIFGLDCNNDTDGDGTPDYLDLNSDNDLCPDAIEGDDNLMNGDLMDNTTIDSGVDECGIPLITGPQGQGIGTSTDPTLMSSSCLSFAVATVSPSCVDNNDGSATITVSNGLSNYMYALMPGGLIQSSTEFEMLEPGSYTVIVTDPNSNFTTTLFFTIDPSPFDCLSCLASSMSFDCTAGTGGSINVTPAGGIAPYCFTINGGPIQKDGLFENLNEGTHVLEILDGSGQAVSCTAVVGTIELPATELTNRICFGDSVLIGTNVYTDSGRYVDTLVSAAGCDSIINLNLETADLIQFDQSISLCEGDSLQVGGNFYTLSGIYADTLQSVSGCDSIINSTLRIFDSFVTDQQVLICEGDSFRIASSIYFIPGSYSDTIVDASGCDSLINTELMFYDRTEINQDISICDGDSLIVENSVYFLPGSYSDTLLTSAGCDSIVHTELRFHPMPGSSRAFSICEGDSIEVAGSVYHIEGNYADTLQNQNGCDSIVMTELMILDHSEFFQPLSLCLGDTLSVGTSVYTMSGDYLDTIPNAQGCDSLISTSVEFIEQIELTQEVKLCPDEFIEVGPNSYMGAGTFTDTLISHRGCDSIVITIIMDLKPTDFFQSIDLCPGESILVGSSTYDLSGSYLDTLTNGVGCDSIIHTDLQFFDSPEINQEVFICEGDSLSIESSVYFFPGSYTDTLSTSNGCDSILHTVLDFFLMPGSSQVFSICEGDSIEVAGSVYHFPGSYADTLLNQNGCDSIILTELHTLDHTGFSQARSLCDGDAFPVGTSIYTTSGDYMDTLVNAVGCDSIVFTSLEFLAEINFSQEAELCPDEFIEVGPNTYSTSGIFIDTLISQRGCDSIVTTTVSDLAPSGFFQTHDLCHGESLPVGSNIYEESGMYVDTLENAVGCDSIVETELIIRDEVIFSQSPQLCANDSIRVGTSTYLEAGIYLDSLLSAEGCDSIVITDLSFLDIEQRSESHVICEGDSIALDLGTFFEPGSHTFLIEVEDDCDYERVIDIEAEDEDVCRIENCKAYIPNVFSPDRDGMNDLFQPFSKAVNFTQMIIYDRWGSQMFHTTDPDPSWDGTFDGRPLLPAVYVYLIKGICKDGEEVLFTDEVTLIR